jgi:hypothetical protein
VKGRRVLGDLGLYGRIKSNISLKNRIHQNRIQDGRVSGGSEGLMLMDKGIIDIQ